MRQSLVLVLVLLFAASSQLVMAQEFPAPKVTVPEVSVPEVAPDTPQATPQVAPQAVPQLQLPKTSNFVTQFLHDQQTMWESPRNIRKKDLIWIAPIGAGAALLMTTQADASVANAVRRNENVQSDSHFISKFGSTQAIAGGSVGLWALGKATHNDKLAETGRLSTDAALQTQLIISGLKLMSRRVRPNGENNQSFPSGHAATSFAFASVIAHEYHDKPMVVVGAYSFATAISLSRIGGLNHFPSDVIIGATIGELIGRYLVHRYHVVE